MVICDSASGAMAIDWNLRGPNFAPVSACAAAADAIGLAYQAIKLGQAKAFVAGGSEATVHLVGILAFDRLGAMSHRNGDPAGACKPFDKNRDGIVMGEGAAALIVEDLEFAQARGAKILAEIVGYGATSDAFHVIAPAENGAGATRAMQRALRDARLRPQDIDWISAHGTATQLNDKFETTAIKDVFGEYAYQIPITSTKPLTGHMMGATGALEVIFGIKAIETGMIPPTINYDDARSGMRSGLRAQRGAREARGHLHEQRLWFWRAQCRVDLETLCRLTAGIDLVAGIVLLSLERICLDDLSPGARRLSSVLASSASVSCGPSSTRSFRPCWSNWA